MTKRATNWLVTHNNPEMGLDEYLTGWMQHCKYVNGQVEAGKNETVHIQAYLSLKNVQRLAWLKKKDPRAHFVPVEFDNGASTYCLKEETRLEGPIEKGQRPVCRQSKKDWEDIKKKCQEGKLDEIPADIYVRCYNQVKKIEKDHQVIPNRTYEKKCFWLWGEPRTGKTREACSEPHYKKKVGKWWCGYQAQKRVVIDDIGPKRGECIVDDLKLWADPWNNQPGETKGGQVPLVFDELYVTSNYPIEEIATGVDAKALRARFEVIYYPKL